MCGICGTAGFAEPHLLERMTDLMAHRGPDDRGVFITPDSMFGLAYCRLSIIDLSPAGHMPMGNENDVVWLTYNGEIYNFSSLRAELEALGHYFRSHTDSEVLVHGYEQWGLDLLNRLNGMFALALLDLRKRPAKLLLARDRFGIKPLYYTTLNGRLIFASEIKAILSVPGVPREVDLASLHRYLAFLWVPGPETMFKHIYKLSPGHYLEWCDGRHSIRSYWDIRFDPMRAKSTGELAVQLREILTRAVKRHLISDVPVGIFLSGGLDSNKIVALASGIISEPLKTYTIAYRPEDSSLEQSDEDASSARHVAQRFQTRHHEILVAPNATDLLPKVIWHLDEPVADPAAISTYLISQAARPDLKVLLSGQGGDEIFAGYRVYWVDRLSRLLRTIPQSFRDGPTTTALNLLPRLMSKIPGARPGVMLAMHRYLRKLLPGVNLAPELRYVSFRSYYSDTQQMALYAPALREALAGTVAGDRHLAYFAHVTDGSFLNRMLYVDMKTFLPELNLTYSDKLSSAASVEVRVPFLDNEVVEFMARMPASLKLKGLKTKYLLRHSLRGMLPNKIIQRRKAGFGAPIRAWLRRDLRDMVDNLLANNAVRRRGYFEPIALRNLIADDREGHEDNTNRIWALITLELWHQTFIDRSI
jgi:asparagine synthase (glutamine-hydrolysing)